MTDLTVSKTPSGGYTFRAQTPDARKWAQRYFQTQMECVEFGASEAFAKLYEKAAKDAGLTISGELP